MKLIRIWVLKTNSFCTYFRFKKTYKINNWKKKGNCVLGTSLFQHNTQTHKSFDGNLTESKLDIQAEYKGIIKKQMKNSRNSREASFKWKWYPRNGGTVYFCKGPFLSMKCWVLSGTYKYITYQSKLVYGINLLEMVTSSLH